MYGALSVIQRIGLAGVDAGSKASPMTVRVPLTYVSPLAALLE